MAYGATAIADWDSDKPVGGSEAPSVLDDALREVKVCVENDLLTSAAVKLAAAVALPGLIVRPKLTWVDADQVKLEPAVIHHQGTVEQLVYWDTQLNFTFGSGGSNSDSTDLAGADWYYLCIDDSAVVTADTGLIAVAQLVAVTTEPAWSVSKHGWYVGNDKCIFGAYTGAGVLLEFFHEGDSVFYADAIENQAAVDIDVAWTDINALILPIFTVAGIATFSNSIGIQVFSWRTNGQTGTAGHIVTGSAGSKTPSGVITDAAHIIEMKAETSDDAKIVCHTDGWKFPTEM